MQEAAKTRYHKFLPAADAAVDSLFPSALALLEQMIRVNSVTPNFYTIKREDVIGGETLCSRMLGEWLAPAGFETHEVAPDPERVNLVALHKGQGVGGRFC